MLLNWNLLDYPSRHFCGIKLIVEQKWVRSQGSIDAEEVLLWKQQLGRASMNWQVLRYTFLVYWHSCSLFWSYFQKVFHTFLYHYFCNDCLRVYVLLCFSSYNSIILSKGLLLYFRKGSYLLCQTHWLTIKKAYVLLMLKTRYMAITFRWIIWVGIILLQFSIWKWVFCLSLLNLDMKQVG